MSGKTILNALAAAAWAAASVVAFFFVAYTTFAGLGVIGLMIWYAGTQFELDGDTPVATASFLANQVQAQREMGAERKMAAHHERSLRAESTRFFRHFGMGLAAIGLAGFLYFQL
jgi:hypothetical protein